MTADLAQACADLAAWLHPTRELITQPDTQPSIGHDKPASKPPWNAAAANLYFDIHAGLRDIEQQLRYDVTGRPAHLCRRVGTWTDQRTMRVLQAIPRLAEAAQPEHVDHAMRQIEGWVTACMQQPAVDLEEQARIVRAACPRCDRAKLLIYERSGRVGCPACRRRGWMVPGTVSAGMVQWEDGEIT